ncbi:MAG: AgmX/PglI C-terminal domain-containing protein [Myxococcales bacterium]|nr:AgmX/PglI C-terminal domain-containing protein [Myxococcales bacterium]
MLAACAPRGDKAPSTDESPESEPLPPPVPITTRASGLPGRALPVDASAVAPPLSLTASDGTGLRLRSLDARASVQEPLAFTELHLTFENPEPRTIEGRFTIDLPPGAAISRFAMKIGEHWQEGEVVERQAARAAYEDFLHRKQDPALMEKEAGNRFSARVFPIPASGIKEIIVSYSQQLPDSAEPYRLMLAGLPKLDQLDARILLDEPQGARRTTATSIGSTVASRQIIEVHERNYVPQHDLEVASYAPQRAMGIRNDDLALARIAVEGDTSPDPITDLTILFDTSASRALDFGGQVQRLGELVDALRAQEGDFRLRLAAFDQDMSLLFDGRAADFGEAELASLYSRRALGASDLASALRRASTITGPSGRVVLMTDGVATAGEQTAQVLAAAKDLERVGVVRLDAIVDGGLQDRDTLEAITTAGLPHDGVVADARLPGDRLARKLRLATLSEVELSVPGASWVWPRTVDGLQPGDEVLVYAQLPQDAAMTVVTEGTSTVRTEVPLHPVDRPLLHRAWVGARIEALQLQHDKLDAERDAKSRQRLHDEIVGLSTKHRVLSDATALLVLETEHDYRRFGIDRRALADILVVGGGGLEWLRRSDGTIAPSEEHGLYAMRGPEDAIPQMARNFDPDMMARNNGILGTLSQESGHFLASPYGAAFATGNDDEDVWGGLTGAEVGEAFGTGGLGLVGTGRGGGGTGEGTIGLGNTGLIGRGGGSGSGYGRGSGAGFGGRGRPVPRVRQAKVKVIGALDKDIVRRIVRAHINEVRHCYNQGLARRPDLRGRVEIQFTVGPTGSVPVSVVAESSLADSRVGQCIAKAAKRWKFPKPVGGSNAVVNYPFVLEYDGPPLPPPPRLTPQERAEQQRLAKLQRAQWKQEERRRAAEAERQRAAEALALAEAERTSGSPYEGRMFDVMSALDQGHADQALALALQWKDEAPGDVVAHLALGEVLEAQGQLQAAARAYGSLIDLFPARADLRRHAGSRLEALGGSALWMAVDTYAQAVEQRPDHPSGHRMLAFALTRVGEHEQAFDAIVAGAQRSYPMGRFAEADRILREDAGLVAAAWLAHEPKRADEIRRRAKDAGVVIAEGSSTRFVMTWETDSNDVDFHIHDRKDGHAYYGDRQLPSGGR